jgi:hypothetical protein
MQVPEGPTYVTAVITCVLNALFALTSTVSNTIILLVIIRKPNLHTPANVLLGCLALSDLVIGSITQPAYVAYKVAEILVSRRVSCVARVIHWVVGWICSGVSMFTITALAVERFLALHLHLRYAVVVTVRKALMIVTLFWVVGILIIMSLFALKSDRYWTFVPAPVMVLNLIITVTAYWKIYRILQKHRNQIHDQMQAQVSRIGDPPGGDNLNIKRYRKSAVTAMYVLVLLLLCYIPFFCSMVTRVIVGYKPAVKIAYESGATIVYLNSTLNPVLFCYRVPDIRREVKKVIHRFYCKKTIRPPITKVVHLSDAQRSKSVGIFDRPEIKMLYW